MSLECICLKRKYPRFLYEIILIIINKEPVRMLDVQWFAWSNDNHFHVRDENFVFQTKSSFSLSLATFKILHHL